MERQQPEAFRGYSRGAVDQFLAAASEEIVRLETAIAEAKERTRRARESVGAHRVMVAMLLQTQERVVEMRRRAEADAAGILERASSDRRSVVDHGLVIDLATADDEVDPVVAVRMQQFAGAQVAEPQPGGAEPNDESSGYFEYLRGALANHEPLGPGQSKEAPWTP